MEINDSMVETVLEKLCDALDSKERIVRATSNENNWKQKTLEAEYKLASAGATLNSIHDMIGDVVTLKGVTMSHAEKASTGLGLAMLAAKVKNLLYQLEVAARKGENS